MITLKYKTTQDQNAGYNQFSYCRKRRQKRNRDLGQDAQASCKAQDSGNWVRRKTLGTGATMPSRASSMRHPSRPHPDPGLCALATVVAGWRGSAQALQTRSCAGSAKDVTCLIARGPARPEAQNKTLPGGPGTRRRSNDRHCTGDTLADQSTGDP